MNLLRTARKQLLHVGTETYRRPIDLINLSVGALVLITASLLILARQGLFQTIDFGLFQRINVYALPDVVITLLIVVMQAGSFAAVPVLAVAALLLRRLLMARKIVIGGTAAWFLAKLLKAVLVRGRPMSLLEDITVRGLEPTGLGFPSGHAAIAATLATVAHPYLNRPLRRAAWIIVALVAVARVYVGAHFPLDVIGGIALGLVIGTLINLLFGVPKDYVPTELIRDAFEKYDVHLEDISLIYEDARGSDPYLAESKDGKRYFVKIVGSEHRNADFLFKVWRTSLLKNTGPNTPYLTPQQQIEHEAYLVMRARDEGVRTPHVEFTTVTEAGFALLAQEYVRGRRLDQLGEDEITDELVHELWCQVQRLHTARIAHRDVRAANILADDEGMPWLIDFGFSVSSTEEQALAVDVAQLLAVLAPLVGVERAVDGALNVLSEEEVIHAIPVLRPLIVSDEGYAHWPSDGDVLDELRETIAKRTGTDLSEEETVLRIQPRTVLWIVGLGLGVFLLFPQLAELGQVLQAWRQADLIWVTAGLVGSALTYAAAALAQQGAVQEEISYWRSVLAHVAASFANRFGPRGVGGAIVLERFLEHAGLRRRRAVAGTALELAASSVVHGLGLVLVVVFLGTGRLDDLGIVTTLRENWTIVGGVLVGAALLLAALWKPLDVERYVRSARKALADLLETLKRPRQALQLFGGAIAVLLAYAGTLLVSMWAVGAQVSIVTAAAVYLAGELLGSVSPTPGGLGVLEGALVAGFTAFGVPSGEAVAGVLLYRLLTFWLPIVPGLFALRYLEREAYL